VLTLRYSNQIKIMDSWLHLTHPLGILLNSTDPEDLKITQQAFRNRSSLLPLLRKKQLMCYEFLDFENVHVERDTFFLL